MRFANVANAPLSFDLAGVHYSVGVGEIVEIPDVYAYAVKLCQIQLTPAKDVEPDPVPPVLTVEPTAGAKVHKRSK